MVDQWHEREMKTVHFKYKYSDCFSHAGLVDCRVRQVTRFAAFAARFKLSRNERTNVSRSPIASRVLNKKLNHKLQVNPSHSIVVVSCVPFRVLFSRLPLFNRAVIAG